MAFIQPESNVDETNVLISEEGPFIVIRVLKDLRLRPSRSQKTQIVADFKGHFAGSVNGEINLWSK